MAWLLSRKGRLAGWLGRLLVCARPRKDGPCGTCPNCRQAAGLAHPDVHWLFPHTSPGGGSLDRQIDAVQGLVAEEIEARRADALHPGPAPEAAYYLASVQWLRRMVYRTASAGGRKVFILTHADALVQVSDSAGPAANAFLKILEEPPAGTHYLLTSDRPYRLPSTIRSRLAELRLAPLADTEVAKVLRAGYRGEGDLDGVARLAHGSVGEALGRLSEAGMALRQRAAELVHVALGHDAAARYAAVRAQGFKGARAEFTSLLREMEAIFVEVAHAATPDAAGVAPEAAAIVDALAPTLGRARVLEAAVRGAYLTARALGDAAGNGAPMLVLHRVLLGTGA